MVRVSVMRVSFRESHPVLHTGLLAPALVLRNGLSHPRQQEYSHFRNLEKSAGGQAR